MTTPLGKNKILFLNGNEGGCVNAFAAPLRFPRFSTPVERSGVRSMMTKGVAVLHRFSPAATSRAHFHFFFHKCIRTSFPLSIAEAASFLRFFFSLFATPHFSCDTLVLGESLLATIFRFFALSHCLSLSFVCSLWESELHCICAFSFSTHFHLLQIPTAFHILLSSSNQTIFLLDATQIGGGRFQPKNKK